MSLEKDILSACGDRIPRHVAVIMDGNGRWAKQKNMPRVAGHRAGIDTVKRIVEAAGVIGVKYLTLYTFSTENWNRPEDEVGALMDMMAEAIANESNELMDRDVCIRMLGDKEDLPKSVAEKFTELETRSALNGGLVLSLAVNYGARREILSAVRKVAEDYAGGRIGRPDDIDEMLFDDALSTAGMPDPDLLIRTGGECRLSNFLLWQCAYTEFLFVDKFWPDFTKEDFWLAVKNFAERERRFGKTGEQIVK